MCFTMRVGVQWELWSGGGGGEVVPKGSGRQLSQEAEPGLILGSPDLLAKAWTWILEN